MKSSKISLTLFAILCGIVSIIACTKYKDSSTYSGDLPTDKTVTGSFSGRVLDENGNPVSGATVTAGGTDSLTDADGKFSFSGISVSSRFGYVTVSKSGYFTGSRSVITNQGGSNYMTITLIPRTQKGSFTAASFGRIGITEGDSVIFNPSTIVTASTGVAYSGTVHVYAAYLDPTATDMSQKMPGDLRGIGTDGKETALISYGMMVVELEGDAGEKLQIASGKTATVTMTIPPSLQASAAATIPLWYFSDTTGKWMEEGSASKDGSKYVGTVSHFTWWNCDAPIGAVNFKVYLKDSKGAALRYTPISIIGNISGQRSGFTDSLGFASGLVPKGETLLFQVLNPCGEVAFGSNVGPLLSDQDLGTWTIDMDTSMVSLSGTVVDCGNSAVSNGYVVVKINGAVYGGPVTNGKFNFSFVKCNKSAVSAQVYAGDNVTSQAGTASTVTLVSGANDLGQLSACGGVSYSQQVNLTVDGVNYVWTDPSDAISLTSTSLSYMDYTYSTLLANNSTASLNIQVNPALTTTGTFASSWIYFSAPGSGKTYYQSSATLTVTSVGDIGGNITGTVNGTLITDTLKGTSVNVSGTIMVKRPQLVTSSVRPIKQRD